MPTPVSPTESSMRSPRAQRDGDLAFERELEGVGEQVEHDLLPHVAVDVRGLGERRTIHHQSQAGLLDRGTKDAGELRRQRGEIGGLVARFDAAGFDA